MILKDDLKVNVSQVFKMCAFNKTTFLLTRPPQQGSTQRREQVERQV